MTTAKQIWVPRVRPFADYGTLDKPEQDLALFRAYDNNTWTHEFADSYTGNKVNFGRTLSGSDNKIKNLQDVWRYSSGYGQTHGLCKNENYISWHLGAIPSLETLGAIQGFSQHVLPGYVGVRFEYRWPYDNNRNYWSNSPVHINDLMLHFYNPYEKRTESFDCELYWASPSSRNFWPDRYVDDDNRRSDTWKGCYWQPAASGARARIRNLQLCMIGMSVEMKYSPRGGASHSRCMDIRNFTPCYEQNDGHSYVPCLAKPRSSPWDESGTMELYTA